MEENNSFKPYVSADKVLPEFTPSSIIIGVLLAIVFGAANAYLGLRVGMTVSASIPAAVIGMGVYKLIGRFSTKKDDTILESNMVQTIGSAGESLAAGAIFTMPALFLWAAEGKAQMPGIVEIAFNCNDRRSVRHLFHGAIAQGIDRKRAWNPSVSGGNSVCRGFACRTGRRR